MCNSKNPMKNDWFNGTNPKVYTFSDRQASNFSVLGECADGSSLFSFNMGNRSYVGKGQQTSSGKGFRYLTTHQTTHMVTSFDEANKLF